MQEDGELQEEADEVKFVGESERALPPPFTRLSGYSQLLRSLLEDIPGTICFRQSTGRGACRKRGSQICQERWLSANALVVKYHSPPPPLGALPVLLRT